MATAKKKESVENEIETTEESQQEEVQQDTISDRKIILAPLARYGMVAVIMASIIVTTAIMMNKEFNDIDAQVAALETEIAQQNQPVSLPAQQTELEIIKTAEEISKATTETIASNDEITAVTTSPEVILPIATAPAVAAIGLIPAQPASNGLDPKTRIARFHKFMAQQDQKHLDSYKASQAKQIEMLRAQLAKQQERIEVIEKRNLESYAMRKAAIKSMQEARKQSLNRI